MYMLIANFFLFEFVHTLRMYRLVIYIHVVDICNREDERERRREYYIIIIIIIILLLYYYY